MRQFLPLLAAADAAVFPVSCSHDGQAVEVGHVTYRIFEAQWMTQIPQDPAPGIPQHRFLLIGLSSGGGSADVPIPGVTLEAGDGVTQWLGILRKVQPGDSAALVDIPLSLNPEAPPQIAIPEGKKQ
jgi:hypothetical protein